MTEEARRARNEYQRKWRRENPEKFQAQIERYWQKKAQQMRMKAESADKPTPTTTPNTEEN